MFAQLYVEWLKWTDATEKQPVLKNAIFLSNLFPILALQMPSDNSQIVQGQRWAEKRLTEASVAVGNIQGEEGGKQWLSLGQVPHLVGSVASPACVLPKKKGWCRAGNKQPAEKFVTKALLQQKTLNWRLSRYTFTC